MYIPKNLCRLIKNNKNRPKNAKIYVKFDYVVSLKQLKVK